MKEKYKSPFVIQGNYGPKSAFGVGRTGLAVADYPNLVHGPKKMKAFCITGGRCLRLGSQNHTRWY